MKRICFLLFIVCLLLVSCDMNSNGSNHDKNVLAEFSEDSVEILNMLGEVAEVYNQSTPRFYNGQEIDKYIDKNGNTIPLSFNSWLIAFRSFDNPLQDLFDRIPCEAQLHNSHGYDLSTLSPDWTYIEYCEYRFRDESEFNKIGDLCFIEIRMICDEINEDTYYAKNLAFDPSLTCEITHFGINIQTGEPISFDRRSGTTGPRLFVYDYFDDGNISRMTDFDENNQVTGTTDFEYDSEGFLVKSTYRVAGGSWYRESFFDATGKPGWPHGTVLRQIKYDADGKKEIEKEFNSDGYLKKQTQYYSSGSRRIEHFFDETANNYYLHVIKYYESGSKESETYYDGTGNTDDHITSYEHWNEE